MYIEKDNVSEKQKIINVINIIYKYIMFLKVIEIYLIYYKI